MITPRTARASEQNLSPGLWTLKRLFTSHSQLGTSLSTPLFPLQSLVFLPDPSNKQCWQYYSVLGSEVQSLLRSLLMIIQLRITLLNSISFCTDRQIEHWLLASPFLCVWTGCIKFFSFKNKDFLASSGDCSLRFAILSLFTPHPLSSAFILLSYNKMGSYCFLKHKG